jgi:hypothetical protein
MESNNSADVIQENKKKSKPHNRIMEWLSEPAGKYVLPEGVSRTDEFGRPLTRMEIAQKECWDLRATWAKCMLNKTWLQSCNIEHEIYQKCLNDFLAVSKIEES